MTQSLTERIQQSRLMVVEVDKDKGRLRVRGEADACTDLTCHDQTVVVTDEATHHDLDVLNPGDMIRVESAAGRADRIVVVRRAWDEIASPEI